MGFAQKLGEFTEGFARGLGPGLEIGSRMSEAKSRRAAASTRENRLAKGAEKAMLWKMFELDPAGAMAKAESLGYSELATSFRRSTKGTVGKSFATALAGTEGALTVPDNTDWTVAGMQKHTKALNEAKGKTQAAIGGLDIASAQVPPGFEVDQGPINLRRQELLGQLESQELKITAMDRFVADIQGINYLSESSHEQIDKAANSYAAAMNVPPENVRAFKRNLRESAKEGVIKAFTSIIETADATALDELEAKYPVLGMYQELDALISVKHGTLERATALKGLSPAERQEQEFKWKVIKELDESAKLNAKIDPERARIFLEQKANLLEELGVSPARVEAFRNSIASTITSYSAKDYDRTYSDVVLMLMDPFKRQEMSQATGMDIGDIFREGMSIDSPAFRALATRITDIVTRSSSKEDDSNGNEDYVNKAIQLLLKGNEESTEGVNNNFSEGWTDVQKDILIPMFKDKGWGWNEEEKEFFKLSAQQDQPTQQGALPPMPGALPGAPPRPSVAQASPNQQQAVAPFLGGQPNA